MDEFNQTFATNFNIIYQISWRFNLISFLILI